MYSIVSVCISYCFYCYPTVSYAFLPFLMFFYCFRMQKLARGVAPQSLSQVHASFRRYMYDHQVEEAECPLFGAIDQCTSPTILHVPHGHGTGQGKDSVNTVTCGYIMTLKA